MDESLAELETQCNDKAQLKNHFLSKVQFGNVLEMLFSVKYFVEHVSHIICTTIRQLGALFEVEKQYINISKSIHFQSVFHHIAELLVIVITFQDLLQNASLSNYWQFYKQAINSIKYNLDEFDVKYEKSGIIGVENVLLELEQLLLGDLFEELLVSIANVKSELTPKTLGVFSGHVFSYIKTTLTDILKCETEFHENFDVLSVVKVTSMSVLYHHLFGNLDKSLFRQVLELNLKHCVVTLLGNLLWQVEKFLNKHISSLMKGRERLTSEILKNRQNYLSQRNQNLTKETKQYFTQVTLWSIEFKSVVDRKNQQKIDNEELKKLNSLIFQGIHLSAQISHLIRTTTNLHVFLSVRMNKTTLFSITKLLEVLQSIRMTFDQYNTWIVGSLHFISQYIVYKILNLTTAAKKKLTESSVNERHLDIIAALTIAEKAFYGPPTLRRMYVGRLALGAADPGKTFDSDVLSKFEKYLREIEIVIKITEKIEQVTDSSFLYWHSSIIPLHFRMIYESNEIGRAHV